MPTIQSPSPGTDLAKLLSEGKLVKLGDLLKRIAPSEGEHDLPVPPIPSSLSKELMAAMERLPEVFGKVQPDTRRELQPAEVSDLYEERALLKTIEKGVTDRIDATRSVLYHHFDVKLEADDEHARDAFETDKDGFFLKESSAPIPGTDQQFKREVREGTPTLLDADLQALVESGDLAKEDYLAMTTQVRTVDENKVMLLLKKKPDLLGVITKAASSGKGFTQLWVRKNKTR